MLIFFLNGTIRKLFFLHDLLFLSLVMEGNVTYKITLSLWKILIKLYTGV